MLSMPGMPCIGYDDGRHGLPIAAIADGSEWLPIEEQKSSCGEELMETRGEIAGVGAGHISSGKSCALQSKSEEMHTLPFSSRSGGWWRWELPRVCASFIFWMAECRMAKTVSRSPAGISSSWLSLSDSSLRTLRIKSSWSPSTGLPSWCALRMTWTRARTHCLASSDMCPTPCCLARTLHRELRTSTPAQVSRAGACQALYVVARRHAGLVRD